MPYIYHPSRIMYYSSTHSYYFIITIIKDNNGRLITESKEVSKELLNGKGTASCLELPSSVRREVEVEEIGQEEVETAIHKMKKRQGDRSR